MSRKERCQRKSFPGITQKDCEEPKRRWPKFRLFLEVRRGWGAPLNSLST